ncbi:MAG: MBL fold metallo-hydrolase [Chloroflexota bacterium]|nr:MBL fold metallo-hydrolase [Chloroflexota bacterium]
MKWTILGSGGCMVIPKPLCQCRVCREARKKGVPYSRAGPCAYLHDANLLIDTPAEVIDLLNRCDIRRVDCLLFTHLDPDHVEGFRVVEQTALDFRTWTTYPEKQIRLLLPEQLNTPLRKIQSQYGRVIDFYVTSGFVRLELFRDTVDIGNVRLTGIPVDRGSQVAFVYVFEKSGRKVVYAPCDLKPFPERRIEVQEPDLLIIQPGIFETGLKHHFKYPPDHISRTTLYTYEQTLDLAKRIGARRVVFVHLEEYWNRSHDDYRKLETDTVQFGYDGMELTV